MEGPYGGTPLRVGDEKSLARMLTDHSHATEARSGEREWGGVAPGRLFSCADGLRVG